MSAASDTQMAKVGIEQGATRAFVKSGGTLDIETGGVLSINGVDKTQAIADLADDNAAIAIVAGTTRTQAGATALTKGVNRVDTSTAVATGTVLGDGVVLRAGPGQQIVINNTNNNIQVYGAGTDTINGIAGATGIALPPGDVAIFRSAAAGSWHFEAGIGAAGAFDTVLSADAVSAAGTNQGTATQLAAVFNRIGTAAAGTGVLLPAAKRGVDVVVLNNGANPVQVYGAGTDTINGIAAGTGVTQMANSMVLYVCFADGAYFTEGLATGFAGSLQTLSFSPALSANIGGGQGSATALPSMINRVSTVASQGDSVKLPASAVGLAVTVINRGANPMQVFGAGTDTINGIATATGISQGVGTAATYVCNVAGNWEVPITALQSTTPQALANNTAIPAHTGHTYVITKGSIEANTLAAPTAGADDGIEITLTSDTAFAHTLTATGLLDTGSASVNVATFAAFKGAGLTLMAYNGRWKVLSQIGITFS